MQCQSRRMPPRQSSAVEFIASDVLPWSIRPDGGSVGNRWDNVHLPSRADTLQWHGDQTAQFCTQIWQAAMVAADANLLAWNRWHHTRRSSAVLQSHCSQILLKEKIKTSQKTSLQALFSPQSQWLCTGMSSVSIMRIRWSVTTTCRSHLFLRHCMKGFQKQFKLLSSSFWKVQS